MHYIIERIIRVDSTYFHCSSFVRLSNIQSKLCYPRDHRIASQY